MSPVCGILSVAISDLLYILPFKIHVECISRPSRIFCSWQQKRDDNTNIQILYFFKQNQRFIFYLFFQYIKKNLYVKLARGIE